MDLISIIFPHRPNQENDYILGLKLDMLKANTVGPYEISYVVSTNPADVYPSINFLASRARGKILLWDSSDIVYGPGWDRHVRDHIRPGVWLGIHLVEPGVIGVAPTNIQRDFGRTFLTFHRGAFEDWCEAAMYGAPAVRDGFAWYSPSCFDREWFLSTGGLPTEIPFPHPNDIEFKRRVEQEGCRFQVVNGYAYHFQRAQENLGLKPERR